MYDIWKEIETKSKFNPSEKKQVFKIIHLNCYVIGPFNILI